MSFVVCPVLPFPNVYWWSHVVSCPHIILDSAEHFEKMSFRNRYMVAGSAGVITLSIPIVEGRQQRKSMKEVLICNRTNWQIQHWRTLKSVYNRSPYFEFFEPELSALFDRKFEQLTAFNLESVHILAKLSGIKLQIEQAFTYQKEYPEAKADIRADFRSNKYNAQAEIFPVYHQVFGDRSGFLPNLSMLDLLFAEGRSASEFLPKF